MVIVMPAFTECQQGKQGIVSAVIIGFEASASPDMRHGIDADGDMKQQNR
jgi:hypothetical protein